MDDIKKTEQSHDVSIALIQKDIGYIRESLTKIDTTMALFDRNFARKEEVLAVEKLLEKIVNEFKKDNEKRDRDSKEALDKRDQAHKEALDKKVDNEVFDPIKKMLGRINWLLISAIIVGALALIIKAGK